VFLLVRLLLTEDGILGGFGDAELHDAFGGDLDRFAGGRVAADARFAVHEHELAETGNGESVFGVFVGQVDQRVQGCGGLFFGESGRLSDGGNELVRAKAAKGYTVAEEAACNP